MALSRFIGFGLFMVALAANVWAQDPLADSPLTKAKVGDWVEFTGQTSGGVFPGMAAPTLTIRYTVKAKTETEATLAVTTWVGNRETGEREIKMPLNKPLDIASLTPGKDDKVEIKLEETLTDRKLKVGKKEFTGTIYKYKMAIDLFGGLDLGGGGGKGKKKSDDKPKEEDKPSEKAKGKPIEMTIGIFLSPEAPVIGMVSMSMDGITKVVYKISDGTGVGPLLNPPKAPEPSPIDLAQVGDWLEYQGKNKVDDRLVVLRHTVLENIMQPIPNDKEGKEQPALKIEAALSVDGKEVSKWEFVEPTSDGLSAIPRWPEWGYMGEHLSYSRKKASGNPTLQVLGDTWIEVAYPNRAQLTIKADGQNTLVYAEIGRHSEIPLTGIAAMRLERHNVVDLELVLAKASGAVKITKTAQPPRPKKTSKTKSKTKEEEPDEPKDKKKPKTKPKTK